MDALKLKKQILHTLFQAVKAVTGGVAALKGQLIKGSGYVVAKGGKVSFYRAFERSLLNQLLLLCS